MENLRDHYKKLESLPTLEYLLKRGTISIVKDYYDKQKNKKNNQLYLDKVDDEKMSIYLTYYMLYKFPDLIDKLSIFTDSFKNDINYALDNIFAQFVKVYYLTFYVDESEFTKSYESSLSDMFAETTDTFKVEKIINNQTIKNAIKVYYLSGNRLHINMLNKDIDENELSNYIYNDLFVSKIYISKKLTGYLRNMDIDQAKEYVDDVIKRIEIFDMSQNMLCNILKNEKELILYIIASSDEQIETIENKYKVEIMRGHKKNNE